MDDNNLNYFIVKSLPRKHNYVGTFTADEIVNNPLLNINLNSKKDFFYHLLQILLKQQRSPFKLAIGSLLLFLNRKGVSH